LTLLLISLAIVALGIVLVFDVAGLTHKSRGFNRHFTPWGRRLATSGRNLPDPYKMVGWTFLIPGTCLLLLAVAAILASL